MRLHIKDKLIPERVLYEFDHPMIFTSRDQDGDLLLVYQCGEDDTTDTLYHIVVPFDEARLADLTQGRMAVLDALLQPWMWLVTGTWDAIADVRACSQHNLPEVAGLPKPGIMLWPSLEPFLNYRLIGAGLTRGELPGAVVSQGITGPSKAIKGIANYVKKKFENLKYDINWLIDIKVQRFAFASFEVGFKVEMPHLSPEDNPLPEIKRLLSVGLSAASVADHSRKLTDYFESDSEGKIVLGSIQELTPPDKGIVSSTQVGGRLLGQRISLSRKSRKYVINHIKPRLSRSGEMHTLTGRIGDYDYDHKRFVLRDIDEREGEVVVTYILEKSEIMHLFNEQSRIELDVQMRANGNNVLIGPIRRLPNDR